MFKAFTAIKQAFSLIKSHPWIIMPFVLLALFEGVVLYFLFLAPQQPFATLLAPPISRFYGEQFIHYPFNLFKLPVIFYHCKLAMSLLPGMILTVIVVGMIGDIKSDSKPSIFKHLKTCLQRFLALFIIWALNIGLFFLLSNFREQMFAWFGTMEHVLLLQLPLYFLSFWMQIIFIYAIPLIVLSKASLLRVLINNFLYLKRLFLPTSLCLLAAAIFYLGLFFVEIDIQGLATRISPEIVLVVLAGGIGLTFVINLLVTTTSTLLFVNEETTNPSQTTLTA